MRRGQRIEARHVLGPFAALLGGAFVVLIVWTIVNPPTWERLLDEDDVDKGTFGHCDVDMWWTLPLDLLVTVAVVTALWMSLHTRHLPEDISDSRRVFQTLVAHAIILFS